RGRASFLERFIHCEIYKARPESVIHTHSPGVVPFAAGTVPLRPIYHVAGFLAAGVPVFEIHNVASVQVVVYRAVYTEINARLQAPASTRRIGDVPRAGGGRQGRYHPAASGDAPLGAVEGEGDGREIGADGSPARGDDAQAGAPTLVVQKAPQLPA